jgi:5-formyltetrahydrofolate cyclo-ligase
MVKDRKRAIRSTVKSVRENLSPKEIRELSAAVIDRLKKCKYFQNAKSVMFYFPVKGEVDLLPLMEELLKDKTKKVLLPKITQEDELVAVEVSDMEVLRPGKYGIPEPLGGKIVKPEKIDLVIVPGVAFDEKCNRLGMGKGYYDRFLPRVKGKKVGVAYDFQIIPSFEFPKEAHDEPVDAVITPTRVYKKED